MDIDLIAEVLHGGADRRTLEEVLELMMERLENADRGCILSDIQNLEVLAYHGDDQLRQKLPFSREVVKTVIHDGLGVVSFNPFHYDLPDSTSVKANGLRSALCVPVLDGMKTVGILYFDARARARAFTENDLKFVNEVVPLLSRVLSTS